MPSKSLKVGVDLVPIKNLSGCVCIEGDITSPTCVPQIKQHIKHFHADVVLNDGAPNVGSNWDKDAYNQVPT